MIGIQVSRIVALTAEEHSPDHNRLDSAIHTAALPYPIHRDRCQGLVVYRIECPSDADVARVCEVAS